MLQSANMQAMDADERRATRAHTHTHTYIIPNARCYTKYKFETASTEGPKKKWKKSGSAEFHRMRIYTQESAQVFIAGTRVQTLSRASEFLSCVCVLQEG